MGVPYPQPTNYWPNINTLQKQKSSHPRKTTAQIFGHLQMLNESAEKIIPFQEEWVGNYRQKNRRKKNKERRFNVRESRTRAKGKVGLIRNSWRIVGTPSRPRPK